MSGKGEFPSRPSVSVSEQSDLYHKSIETLHSAQSFQIRPQPHEKFRPSAVHELLYSVMREFLADKKYSVEGAQTWTKIIANTVRNKIKDKGYKRYKLMVQVVLGEKRGAGVKVGARCLWDADTDDHVTASYTNETIFCVVAVFAVYMY